MGSDSSAGLGTLLLAIAKCAAIPFAVAAIGGSALIAAVKLVMGIAPSESFYGVLPVAAGVMAGLFRLLWRNYFKP